jgi:hypothetical protein
MVFNADGSKMYVLNLGAIWVVDTATNAILGYVTGFTSGDTYTHMAANGTELWACGANASFSRKIFRADMATDAFFVGSISSSLLGGARSVAFNATGSKFYEAGASQSGIGTPQVAIYDATTHTLITTIDDDTSKGYSNIVALPDGSEMWFMYQSGGTKIRRLSTTTDAIVGTDIATSSSSSSAGTFGYVVANPVLPEVYVSLNNGNIDVISTTTHAVVATITAEAHTGSAGYYLSVSPDGNKLYQINPWLEPYSVNVIDTATRLIIDQVTVDSVSPPTPTDVGAFTTLKFAGPVITDDGDGQASLDFPVIYGEGVTSNTNIKANRTLSDRSITDETKKGITNFGSGSTASEDYATVVGGKENVASGVYSTASGYASTASGIAATAVNGGFASGDNAFASNYASALSESSHAEGDGYVDTDSYGAHAEGAGYVGNNAVYAHAEGNGLAFGEMSHAEGSGEADGTAAHAEGFGTTAIGGASHAAGLFARALRYSEYAYSSGSLGNYGTGSGECQHGRLNFWGGHAYGGGGVNATFALSIGWGGDTASYMLLEDDRAYLFTLTALVVGVQSSVQYTKKIVKNFTATCASGTAVIVDSDADVTRGVAQTNTWAISAAASTNTIVFTFTTGAGTSSECSVSALLEWQELKR